MESRSLLPPDMFQHELYAVENVWGITYLSSTLHMSYTLQVAHVTKILSREKFPCASSFACAEAQMNMMANAQRTTGGQAVLEHSTVHLNPRPFNLLRCVLPYMVPCSCCTSSSSASDCSAPVDLFSFPTLSSAQICVMMQWLASISQGERELDTRVLPPRPELPGLPRQFL
jgi:hypothetical protein